MIIPIYRYIRNGVIKVIRFERKTLVRRADIEDMTDFIVQKVENNKAKEKAPFTDFYTTTEAKEKYHVNESWIFVVAKKHNNPRTFNRGKTYWSKKHMDAYFAKKAPNPDISEWYSTQGIRIAISFSTEWTMMARRLATRMIFAGMRKFAKC